MLFRSLELCDERGLPVYVNNYRGQLIGCLEENFPQTLAWIGEGRFDECARHHIVAIPPHSWTLDDYPKGFPASVARAFPGDAEVGELAVLEQALSDAFVTADAEALGFEDIGEVDWESAQLELIPSARLLQCTSNAPEIWTALNAGETPPAAEASDSARTVLVWRRGWTCCFRVLDADEAQLMHNIAMGAIGFEALCEQLVDMIGEDEGPARAGALLLQWAQDGMLRMP